jgi:isopentenyl diphosphate isomerase/L-lactate dehydrogenase-like FMN-dependent dehydrogenase
MWREKNTENKIEIPLYISSARFLEELRRGEGDVSGRGSETGGETVCEWVSGV